MGKPGVVAPRGAPATRQGAAVEWRRSTAREAYRNSNTSVVNGKGSSVVVMSKHMVGGIDRGMQSQVDSIMQGSDPSSCY